MRIDFTKYPECRNCYHCRTSGIFNPQESEPSNVIDSSVTSMPVSSGPVQALGHDSAAVGSTLTSPPVHDSSEISFGSPPPATTSVFFGPAQAVPTISSNDAFGSPSERPALQAPVQATSGSGASANSTSSTSTPVHSSLPFRLESAPAATTWVSSGPTQAFGPATFQAGSIYKAPVQVKSDSGASPFHNYSPFGSAPAFTSVRSSPTQALGPSTFDFSAFSALTPTKFGTMQDPVQSSASTTSTFFPFGCVPGSPTSGSSLFTSGYGSLPASTTASVFDTPTEGVCSQLGSKSGFNFQPSPASGFTLFGSAQDFPKTTNSVCASSTENTPLNSYFPGFGDSSNIFRPNPSITPSFGGGFPRTTNSVCENTPLNSFFSGCSNPSTTTPNFGGGLIGGVKTSSPPFGFSEATTLLSSETFPLSATFCSNSNPFAPHIGQGSLYPGCRRTPDGQTQNGDMYISISASNPYRHKSHEELRWEDYKQGVRGAVYSPPTGVFGPFRAAGDVTTPTSSGFHQTNAVYSSSTLSSTTVPPIYSSVQRPYETAAISSPAPGCTACGARSSSSASGYFTFNGATTPPSAATYLPRFFFPTSGSGPMMFGTTLTSQATTPALQAHPVQGYILLPFGALSLQ